MADKRNPFDNPNKANPFFPELDYHAVPVAAPAVAESQPPTPEPEPAADPGETDLDSEE